MKKAIKSFLQIILFIIFSMSLASLFPNAQAATISNEPQMVELFGEKTTQFTKVSGADICIYIRNKWERSSSSDRVECTPEVLALIGSNDHNKRQAKYNKRTKNWSPKIIEVLDNNQVQFDIIVETGHCIYGMNIRHFSESSGIVPCTDKVLKLINPSRVARVPDSRIKR